MTQVKQTPFAMVPIEAAGDHRLTAMQYRVLIAILSFRSRNSDTVYPKRERLAARTGYSISTISRVTAQLQDLGWLVKTGQGGRSSPSHYAITIPETVADPDTVSSPETLADPATVLPPETVADPETVAGSATVAGPDTKTVADPDTKTVADPARGKEHTREQTNEQTRGQARARARTREGQCSGGNGHGARLPDDWALTDERMAYARGKGLTEQLAREEAEKFADYWRAQPGQKGRKADWEATWRNWCRRAAEQRAGPRAGESEPWWRYGR